MARLFKTSRWLRPYPSKNGHQVLIRVRANSGFETHIPVYDYVDHQKVPISVKKENWNKGYVTGGQYHISIRDINFLLRKVEDNVKDALNELYEKKVKLTQQSILRLTYINEETAEENERKIASGQIIVGDDGEPFASQAEFEDYIAESEDPKFNSLKKKMGIYEKKYILDYWDDFIKDYAPDSYNSPRYSIEDYIKKTEDNCKANEFSSKWLERFFKYIIENGYSFRKDGTNREHYSLSTINKYSRHLKSFGTYLFAELKLLDNQDYNRFKLSGKAKKQSIIKYTSDPFKNTHALYKKEFDWFYAFKFDDNQLEVVRDMFVLQVWLGGLRLTDFYNLSINSFHKDSKGKFKVWFEQKKTDDDVQNVVNQNYLIPILDKYPNGFVEFPSSHEYNKKLKIAAEKAGLTRLLKFRKEVAKDPSATIEWYPIYQKISNKWARNCAVSILAERGYPDERIAKFTGHKDLEMIRHYKEIHGKDVDSMMEEVKPDVVTELY